MPEVTLPAEYSPSDLALAERIAERLSSGELHVFTSVRPLPWPRTRLARVRAWLRGRAGP
jgi:hypothetical protein